MVQRLALALPRARIESLSRPAAAATDGMPGSGPLQPHISAVVQRAGAMEATSGAGAAGPQAGLPVQRQSLAGAARVRVEGPPPASPGALAETLARRMEAHATPARGPHAGMGQLSMVQRVTGTLGSLAGQAGAAEGAASPEAQPPHALPARSSRAGQSAGRSGLPVQRYVATRDEMRGVKTDSEESTGPEQTMATAEAPASGSPNVDELVQRVYRLVKRQLELDNERSGIYLPDLLR
jgi:hypothetical protein